MQTFLAILVLFSCFVGLGIGLLLAKKVLRKGCSDDPEGCACKKEGKNPEDCAK